MKYSRLAKVAIRKGFGDDVLLGSKVRFLCGELWDRMVYIYHSSLRCRLNGNSHS
jgi:hypothetical protein